MMYMPQLRSPDSIETPDYAYAYTSLAYTSPSRSSLAGTIKCLRSTLTSSEHDKRYRLTDPLSIAEDSRCRVLKNVQRLCFYVFWKWLTPC